MTARHVTRSSWLQDLPCTATTGLKTCRLGRTKVKEDLGNPNASPQKKRSAMRDVAAASVLAALEVYEGMENAALSVTKASGDASTNFISHK